MCGNSDQPRRREIITIGVLTCLMAYNVNTSRSFFCKVFDFSSFEGLKREIHGSHVFLSLHQRSGLVITGLLFGKQAENKKNMRVYKHNLESKIECKR